MVLLLFWLMPGNQGIGNLYWIILTIFGMMLCVLWLQGLYKFSNPIVRRIEYLQDSLSRELSLRPQISSTDSLKYELKLNRRKIERWLAHGLNQKTRRKQLRIARELESGWDRISAMIEEPIADNPPVRGFRGEIDHLIHSILDSVSSGKSANVRFRINRDKNNSVISSDLGIDSVVEDRHLKIETEFGKVGLIQSARDLQIDPCQSESMCVYESRQFISIVETARRTVSFEKGVYRIREDMFRQQQSLNCSPNQGTERMLTDRELSELSSFGKSVKPQIKVRDQGLLYDRILAQFTGTDIYSARIRALQHSSSLLLAEGAVLIGRNKESAMFYALTAIGILSDSKDSCAIAPGTPLYEDCFQKSRYVLIDASAENFFSLASAIGIPAHTIFKLKRMALLPIVVDENPAYLLFASDKARGAQKNSDFEWSQQNIIALLNIYV